MCIVHKNKTNPTTKNSKINFHIKKQAAKCHIYDRFHLTFPQYINKGNYNYIFMFTFDVPFDKGNDCVQYNLKEMPHHCRRDFITFYVVNFLLLTYKNLSLIMK